MDPTMDLLLMQKFIKTNGRNKLIDFNSRRPKLESQEFAHNRQFGQAEQKAIPTKDSKYSFVADLDD